MNVAKFGGGSFVLCAANLNDLAIVETTVAFWEFNDYVIIDSKPWGWAIYNLPIDSATIFLTGSSSLPAWST